MNQNQTIDNLNYANDARTQGAAEAPKLSFWGCGVCGAPCDFNEPDVRVGAIQSCDCPDYERVDIEEALPMKWNVCPVCRGEGKHVNPSIDAGGLSDDYWRDDPDFYADYMGGTFDQTCNRCEGKRVVPVVDRNAMPKWQQEAYDAQLIEEQNDRAEYLSEIRMGC